MSELERKSSVGFWVVVICVIAIFMTIALYSNYKPYTTSPANRCINNLRQIDAAAQQFALDKGKTNGEAINYPNDLTPYIKLNKGGKIPPCPSGGIYSIKKVGDVPTCSLGTTVTPSHILP
jgi:type II secretory pathway pseudopilin PulG